MYFDSLQIDGFRNLHGLSINLSKNINWFFGENGSGKTSIFEAFYHFGYGRSFRTNSVKKVISFDSEAFVLFSTLFENAQKHTLGFTKSKDGASLLKVDGEVTDRFSSLVRFCPVLFLGPDSSKQILGSPSARRQILDWLLFHVEHDYGRLTSELSHVLKHRNALLKQFRKDKDQLDKHLLFWDNKFIQLSESIHKKRIRVFEELSPVIIEIVRGFDLDDTELKYLYGWKSNISLEESLNINRERDIQFGTTTSGIHRADIRFSTGGKDLLDIWSRGMLRLLSIIVLFSMGQLLEQRTKRKSVFIVDDMTSELDEQNQLKILGLLDSFDTQVLISQISKEEGAFLSFCDSTSKQKKGKMFHVKQGRITEETT